MKKGKRKVIITAIIAVVICLGIVLGSGFNVQKEKEVNPSIKGATLAYRELGNGQVQFSAKFSDQESGVSKIEYYFTTSSSVPSASSSNWKTTNQYSVSCGTVYYVFARAVDNAGNVSDVSNYLDYYYSACPTYTDYSYYVTPTSSITNTSTGTTVSGGTNTCDATCYLSNNGADWWQIQNSNLPDDVKAAFQSSIHADSENYTSANNVSANYNSSSGQWNDNSGKSMNTSGSTGSATITQINGGYRVTTSNGETMTVHVNSQGQASSKVITSSASGSTSSGSSNTSSVSSHSKNSISTSNSSSVRPAASNSQTTSSSSSSSTTAAAAAAYQRQMNSTKSASSATQSSSSSSSSSSTQRSGSSNTSSISSRKR